MNWTYYYLFTLLLIAQFSTAQDIKNDISNIDSELVWLNDNYVDNPDNFHTRSLNTLADAYQLSDEKLMAEAHLLLMRWHAYHVPFTIDSIYYHGEKAIELFTRIDDQAKLANTSAELAFEYIDKNDLQRSEELIFNAIDIYETLGDQKGLASAYQGLASISLSQKEPESSIKYALEAVEMADKSKDYQTKAVALLTLLSAYHESGQLEQAIQAGDNCIETVLTHLPEDVFTLARGYGYRGDVWADLGNYQESLEDNIKSYNLVETAIGAERPAAKTYRLGIGKAYYMQGKYKDALPHLEASIDGYKSLGQGLKPKVQDLYEDVSDCYYQLGNFEKAFVNQKLAYEVFDTLMNNKVKNLESEAFVKYETGKKDQALEEQSTIIKQKTRIQWLGAFLIGLLLLFLSSLFYYFKRNKKIADALMIKNRENELLLKEIHHRVKNNLQTISSLLSLQSESISDERALNAVQESKNRVASMALIHQKLYQGENLAAIEMRDYFKTIGRAIKDSFGSKAENVSIEVDMSEIELDVDTAIPIGLITNELITNSFKHAFPNAQAGKISITLSKEDDGLLKLNIADDGLASKNIQNGHKEQGFGSLLIQLLTTQLGGTLKKSNEEGTATMIHFPLQEKSVA